MLLAVSVSKRTNYVPLRLFCNASLCGGGERKLTCLAPCRVKRFLGKQDGNGVVLGAEYVEQTSGNSIRHAESNKIAAMHGLKV